MGIFSFLKDAGEKVFGNHADAAEDKAQQIKTQLEKHGVKDVHVKVDGSQVTLSGEVTDPKDKQRAVVIAGNIDGIDSVNDMVTSPKELAQAYYEVKAGDTLSKIAQEFYGDAMKYNVIFKANNPMLTDPDKIYVGQVLIIPKENEEDSNE